MTHETRSPCTPTVPSSPLLAARRRRQNVERSGRGLRRRAWPAVSAWLGLMAWAGAAEATVRPDPLTPEPGCERWVGKAGGNDPSVEIDLVICPEGDGVAGQLQWSSLQSGWNRRGIEGRWRDDRTVLELRDVKILEEKPNPGWRFCTIDQYELTRRGTGRLEGSYLSKRCNDRASVSLTLASDPAGPDATATGPRTVPSPGASDGVSPGPAHPAPSPSGPPSAEQAAPDAERRACSCSVVGRNEPRSLELAWLAAALGAVVAARRRNRRR